MVSRLASPHLVNCDVALWLSARRDSLPGTPPAEDEAHKHHRLTVTMAIHSCSGYAQTAILPMHACPVSNTSPKLTVIQPEWPKFTQFTGQAFALGA